MIEYVPKPIKSELMMLGERLILDGKIEGRIEGENSKELEVILNLLINYPQMKDEKVIQLVRVSTEKVVKLRKQWIGFKTNFQKAQFLMISFPDWQAEEIADFAKLPLLDVEKCWSETTLVQN